MAAFADQRAQGEICADRLSGLDDFILATADQGDDGLRVALDQARYEQILFHIAGCEDCWAVWHARRRSLRERAIALLTMPFGWFAGVAQLLRVKLAGLFGGTHGGVGAATAAGGTASLGGNAAAISVGVVCAVAAAGAALAIAAPSIFGGSPARTQRHAFAQATTASAPIARRGSQHDRAKVADRPIPPGEGPDTSRPASASAPTTTAATTRASTRTASATAASVKPSDQPPVFGTPQPATGTSSLKGIDCTSAQDCVAVGANAAQSGGSVVPVTSDGAPGTEQDVTGAPDGLTNIACDFGGADCLADAFATDLIPIHGGVPAATHGTIPGIDVAGLACPPDSSACLAVGNNSAGDTGEFVPVTNGTPGSVVSVTGTTQLSVVACSAVGDCVAIGQDANSAFVEVQITNGAVVGSPLSMGLSSGQFISGVACAGADNCFAVGFDINASTGLLVPITASGPAGVVAIPSLEQANGIACAPGSTSCVIVGIDGTTFANAAFVPLDGATGAIGTEQADGDATSEFSTLGFYGVACPTATTCLGVLASGLSTSEGYVVPISLTPPAIPPTASITTPAAGAVYATNDPSAPKFDFSCSPGVGSSATITSCVGTVGGATVDDTAAIDTTMAGSFTLTVTATDSLGSTATATSNYTVTAASQTITFPQLGPFAFAHAPVQLTATASSGLPVTYSVVSGPCMVSGSNDSTLSFTGSGSCVVEAAQAGNGSFSPATPVDRTIVVSTATPPSCTGGSVNVASGLARHIALNCADGSSDPGETTTVSIVSGPAHGTLSNLSSGTAGGSVLYTPDAGYSGGDSFTFKASNTQGDSNVATVSIAVAQPAGPPSVRITTPAQDGVYFVGGTATFDYECTAGANGTLLDGQAGCDAELDGGAGAFDTDGANVAAAGHLGTNTFILTATDIDGQTVSKSVTYTVADPQTITFPQLGPFVFGHGPVLLGASASSGLPVSYSVVSGPCTVDNSTSMLTLTGSGSCVVAADQAGNGTFGAAPTVDSTIVISPAPLPSCSPQTLSFPFGAAQTITLVCSDAAGDPGDPLTITIVTPPPHGTLTAPGAAGAVTYTPAAGYSGADGFTFQATDAQGTSSPATVSIVVGAEAVPANASLPGVSGSPAVGQTLTCSNGVWSGGMPQTYTDQWLRDGAAIPGATAATYVVVAADQGHSLTCAVTGSNSGGNATATSAGVGVPAATVTPPPTVTPTPFATVPTNAGLPAITGTASLGFSLSCSVGAWSGTMPQIYSYQWRRDAAAIPGATGAKFVVATTDIGHSLACAVTASNSAGIASAQSAALAIPFPSNAFSLAAKPKASKTGVISFTLHAPGSGLFSAVATFVSKATSAKSASVAASKSKTVTYGRGSATAKGSGSFALTIHPTTAAARTLKKLRHLGLKISVTFTPTGGKPLTRKSSLTVKHS